MKISNKNKRINWSKYQNIVKYKFKNNKLYNKGDLNKKQTIDLKKKFYNDLLKELNYNNNKYNKLKNISIQYGEKFQLQHYRSKKYLILDHDIAESSAFSNNLSL